MKLIIDIPEESYKYIKTLSDLGWLTSPEYANAIRLSASEYANAVKNGTPLDDVKVEIADIYCGQYCENPLTADAVREMILDILDNIGKADMRGDT